MFSKYAFLTLFTVLLINVSYGADLTDCPNPEEAVTRVYDKDIATSVVGSTIRVRVPDSLFLKDPITCIVILDNEVTESKPIIEDGGVYSKWVVISIQPTITELLSYRIQVYTK